MAERRMFSKTIIDSDAFLDMPSSTQSLYFHLSMRADDEGFVNNPRKIAKMVGSNEEDLNLLLSKRFILGFPSGVIVIKHWKINNQIRNDRFKATIYEEEKSMIYLKENGAYTDDNQMATNWQPNGNQLATQYSIGKDSIGKDSIVESNNTHRYGKYLNITLSEEELEKLKEMFPVDWSNKIDRISTYCKLKGKTYSNYFATIVAWSEADKKTEGSFDTDDFFNAAVAHSRQ